MSAPSTGCAELERAKSSPLQPSFLGVLLLLALVRGLTYLVLFPPWQHYDEPTHFEYVRLIAQRGRLPSPGDFDPQMRIEIAASMQAAGFFGDIGAPAIEFWSEEPAWIGVSELEHPPLYYALAALSQVLGAHQSVEVQLYLARLASVALGMVVIGSSYGLVAELFPGRRALPLAVAAFVTFHAPFTDLTSAVNNDIGAAAAAALLLWVVVRTIKRGPTLWRGVGILLLAGACIATKSTSGAVAVVALVAMAASALWHWRRKWLWIGAAAAIPILVIAAFTLSGSAAHWYGENPGVARNRVKVGTPLGKSALALGSGRSLAPGSGQHPRIVFQELQRSAGRALRGQQVSFGAWLRTGEPAGGWVALNLYDGRDNHWYRVQATDEWQFYAFSTTIDPEASGLAAYIIIPDREDAAVSAYADGLVLVEGALPADGFPADQINSGTMTLSGGERVPNLLRNPSAERTWPTLRSWLGRRSVGRSPLSVTFHSLWEWTRTGWVYPKEVSLLFKSFWGTFGWNHLSLGAACFWIAGLVTVASAAGSGLWWVRHRRSGRRLDSWQRRALLVLGCALLIGLIGTLLRIQPVFVTRQITWPVARYTLPVIVPMATLLCFGLGELVPRRLARPLAWVALLGWIAADTIALLAVVVPYYYG